MNHFHNPNHLWKYAGLTDYTWYLTGWCAETYSTSDIRSAITWGTNCKDYQCTAGDWDLYSYDKNYWDWTSALNYYFIYLTGRAWDQAVIAPDTETRDTYLTHTMRALGQVMHLLQDMSVPAHVRDDFSQGHTIVSVQSPKPGNDLEKYARDNNNRMEYILSGNTPIKSGISDMRVTDLWDTDQLFNEYVPTMPMGLAEYANMNFMSEGSLFTSNFVYPREEDCIVWDDVSPYTGTSSPRRYVRTTATHPGEQVDHLAVKSFWGHLRDVHIDDIAFPELIIARPFDLYYMDDACHIDYIEKLLPRAIGYSAELLDHFLRGRLHVKSLPFFENNAFKMIRLNITNITPTEETMSEGLFTLTLRYTPDGTNENVLVTLFGNEGSDEIPFNDEIEVYFYPEQDSPIIPIDGWDKVQATLAYIGNLGEERAVIGKVFTPGKVLFNEEWDRSLLDGYYNWYGTGEWATENYSCTQTVSDGKFVMQVDEYEGDGGAACDLWLKFTTTENPDGMLITENTVLETVIDEMSTSPVEGANGHVMTLVFNQDTVAYTGGFYDNYRIMYKIDGPYLPNLWPLPEYSAITARKIAGAGEIMGEGIYGAFASSGITIPEPLYLKKIGFEQSLFESDEDNHLRTVVDYIRIVEMGDE